MESARTIVARGTDTAPIGYVVVDSTVCGRSRGGLRMLPDVSEDELQKLARAMTLKYGFLGLPQGGAKGGVLADPEAPPEARMEALRRFATSLREVIESRLYVPDADMGTTGSEIQRMIESLGVRVPRREYRGSSSGDYTARTVFESACAAAAAAGLAVAGSRVAIEGFGKVGAPLAAMFVEAGAKVVAVSTQSGALHAERGLDIELLSELARAHGSAGILRYQQAGRIAPQDLKLVRAEILCPCARHDSIRLEDAAMLEARVLSCGANHPVLRDAQTHLWQRGVICVPDFIANCGGVLGGTMEFAGWPGAEIHGFMTRVFRPRVEGLIDRARQSGQTLLDMAEKESLERFAAVKEQAERASAKGRLFAAGVAIYRKGWLPASLMRRLSKGYFQLRVAG